jgi:hypothetical protein
MVEAGEAVADQSAVGLTGRRIGPAGLVILQSLCLLILSGGVGSGVVDAVVADTYALA